MVNSVMEYKDLGGRVSKDGDGGVYLSSGPGGAGATSTCQDRAERGRNIEMIESGCVVLRVFVSVAFAYQCIHFLF